jgi:hypothetical protein
MAMPGSVVAAGSLVEQPGDRLRPYRSRFSCVSKDEVPRNLEAMFEILVREMMGHHAEYLSARKISRNAIQATPSETTLSLWLASVAHARIGEVIGAMPAFDFTYPETVVVAAGLPVATGRAHNASRIVPLPADTIAASESKHPDLELRRAHATCGPRLAAVHPRTVSDRGNAASGRVHHDRILVGCRPDRGRPHGLPHHPTGPRPSNRHRSSHVPPREASPAG